MKHYVYCYRDWRGVPRYVGKGCGSRAQGHVGLARAINEGRRTHLATPFLRWLAKQLHNERAFTCEVLAEGLSEQQALAAEIVAIATFGRVKIEPGGTLLNRLCGGDGVTSEDARRIKNTPSALANASRATKLALSDPLVRARMSAATTISNGSQKRRAESRLKALSEWANPARKAAAAQRARELWADPEWSGRRRAELTERNKRNSTNRK